ncbi:MAG: F0F1 ATP synthase subunit B [Calditrichaeota bacterium]|nr:F0F1 ATP synthase subunit B [Candidatus Cloacimonadota bacterium]MCA9787194.1 F0F1 ATP synthase subunit B [Candidatus Cloacimonadota bacterium]MCB1046983.1 F0F1 ATP synthase subunit B [Calditrichota bacterium]MCB9473347.1 F0F1 ATP synthase subunit B [Candidatus Delongbacteria bacterium]
MKLNQIFSLDPGSVLWTLLTFALLLFLLGKFAWGPILAGLKAREQGIKDSIDKARSDQEAAARARQDHERELASGRADAQKLLAESRDRAKKYEAEQVELAKAEAQKLKEKANEEIALQGRQALQNLQGELVDLTLDAAGKLLGKNLDPATHAELVRDSLASLGRRS